MSKRIPVKDEDSKFDKKQTPSIPSSNGYHQSLREQTRQRNPRMKRSSLMQRQRSANVRAPKPASKPQEPAERYKEQAVKPFHPPKGESLPVNIRPTIRKPEPPKQDTPSPQARTQPRRPFSGTMINDIAPPKSSTQSAGIGKRSRKTVHGMISVAAFFKKILSRFMRSTKKSYMVFGAVAIFSLFWLTSGSGTQDTSNTSGGDVLQADSGQTSDVQPSFTAAVPNGKDISQSGGWAKISPPGTDPVYGFSDKIGDVTVNVSQQLLPEDFRDDTAAKVETMANNFNANEQISVDGVSVYIGTSSDGPQSVIFYKDELLFLIKSQSEISTEQWSEYVRSLQPAN